MIFSADNGPEHDAYSRIQKFQHRSAGPLRSVKRDLWDGGHRVPFIVRWPGIVPRGEASPALSSQVDILATLAAITGFTLPANPAHDSHDSLNVWKSGAPSPRPTIVHNTNASGYALRHNQWLLVAAKTGAVSKVPAGFDSAHDHPTHDQPGELFDLTRDLTQHDNLDSRLPEKVARLRALLEQVRQTGQVR